MIIMRKPESILDIEMHKILWGIQIKTDHVIPARSPEQSLINKRKKNLLYSEKTTEWKWKKTKR